MTLPGNCNYHQAGRDWSVLRIQDLVNPPQNWIALKGCFWGLGHGPNAGLSPNGTEAAASPDLSYPPDILTLDPIWASAKCSVDAYNWAFYDPPRVLTPVTAIVPSTTQVMPPNDPQDPSVDPAPANSPAITAAPKTITPVPVAIPLFDSAPSQIPALPLATSTEDPTEGRQTTAPEPRGSDYRPKLTTEPSILATVGNTPVYIMSDGGISVDGEHYDIDNPVLTIDNTPISVAPDAIYVGSSSYMRPVPTLSLTQPPKVVAGQFLEADQSGGVVLGNNIIRPGQQMDIDGSIISVEQDHLVIDGKAYAMPSTAPNEGDKTRLPSNVGGALLSLGNGGTVMLGSSLLAPGQHTDIQGTYVSVGSNILIIGTSTYDNLPATPT